ncbi:hypothetical protein K2F43_06025 [Clostridium estertheticum]|uniref:hypothetical protein n=1 Tax=Clostridium estertheticum TaxID=238834 RepID=UPI001C6EBD71|nr:hypothetical protein [Clostridium estertheticum]MBW9170763.1 hypothetical protein [Clostridium estertheticum]WLC74398.1 hypothetical protein KTC99_16730 [Clostridium estertheticum]
MMLRHRDWDKYGKLQKTMTVEDFIKEIVLTDKNKECKYYRISLTEQLGSKSNLMIYYQDNIVKSHHSTRAKFDYKDVLDNEIIIGYSERTITVEDIISMKLDFVAEDKVHTDLTQEERDKVVEKLHREWDEEELEKSNRKNVFNGDVGVKELVACVQQLVKDLEKQNSKNYEFRDEIAKCKDREDILQQQIKWLEYRIDKKL